MTRSFIHSVACALALSGLTIACNQNKEAAPEPAPATETVEPKAAEQELQNDRAKEDAKEEVKDKHRAM